MGIRTMKELPRMKIWAALVTCCIATFFGASPSRGAADAESAPARVADVRWPADGKVDFVRDVQPILRASCVECHSADNKKGRLRLDAKPFATAGGQSGAVLAAGEGKPSILVKRVTGQGGEKQMPFKRPPLPDEQIRVLTAWVEQGAPWPDGVDGVVKEEKPHWAFVMPVRHDPPAVKQQAWVRNPIDSFILARLEKDGLAPSPEAGKVELIRRATLDLIGLPPTLAEVDAFLADAAPDAYEKLVERLLASPHYGERWARQWLDVARYADTNGYEKDRPRNIYPYRDWVISAFNRDLPFDRFTVEQIAGDLLPNATPEQVIATGFHRNTMINEEGGIDVAEFRFKAVVDRVETTATAWLGLTFQCAQCHNHKYDPFTQKEYYRLFAMLNNADEPEYRIPDPAVDAKRGQVAAQIAAIEANLENEFPAAADERMKWTALRPTSFSATSGATFAAAEDGAVLVSGPAPQTDAYTFQVTADPKHLTAIRLEALTDPTLPRNGPGRLGQAGNGNFVLTELKVTATAADGQPKPLAFRAATADAAQSGFDPAGALDGNPATGWAIDDGSGNLNQDRAATFQLAEPLAGDAPVTLTVTLEQAYATHTLGKFRVWAGHAEPAPGDIVAASAQERGRQHLAAKLAAWEQQAAAKAGRWTVVRPAKMASRGHATMVVQPDGSVLVSGDWPNNDVYELDVPTEITGITGIKLEVLPDESFPENGPGRAPLFMPGDFMLSEFELKAGPIAAGEPPAVKPSGATHSFAGDGRSAQLALDGRIDTGWSVGPRTGQAHQAVFVLPAPVGGAGGTRLAINLVQQYIHQTTIGRFRISVTTDPQPADATDLPADVEAILATAPAASWRPDRHARLKSYFLSVAPELAPQRQRIAELRRSMPRYRQTMVMRERLPEHARVTTLYHRGEFLQPRDPVTPGVPGVLHPLPAGAEPNRLGLAKWLVDENNPMVGRVVMNRAWATFFGRGIVNTVQDFGLMGEPPSHPELLDWLATEFPRRGWSMKAMHRLIVTSATYRQDNRVTPDLLTRDPGNVLLARGPRNRVEAEMVRDLALSVGGLLDPRVGGPSVFPPQPDGVSELSYGATPWPTSTGGDRWRRGLYTYLKRTSPYPAMLTFDAPSSDITCVRRPRSNTPLQALTLLNDKVFVEASQALARRVLKEAPASEPAARAGFAFRLCTGREASADELAELTGFVDAQLARFRDGSADANAVAASEALPAPAGADLPEMAAWTVVARALLNLDETITK
jgi:mono/diheme cytochrome c family protein